MRLHNGDNEMAKKFIEFNNKLYYVLFPRKFIIGDTLNWVMWVQKLEDNIRFGCNI